MIDKEMPGCPMNLDGEYMDIKEFKSGLRRCRNWTHCNDTSRSWTLPYEYDSEENCLRVFSLPGIIDDKGEKRRYDDREFYDRVQEEWKKAGWARAEPIPQSKRLDVTEDIIPF